MIVVAISGVLIFFLLALWLFLFHSRGERKQGVGAQDSQYEISVQAQWSAGSLENISADIHPGSIEINNKTVAETEIDNSGFVTSTNYEQETKDNPLDGNLITRWRWILAPGCVAPDPPEETCGWWKVDLGGVYNGVNKIRMLISDTDVSTNVFESSDDLSYNHLFTRSGDDYIWHEYVPTPTISTRYIKFRPIGTYSEEFSRVYSLYELEIYNSIATATHTTAPTQIDGQEGSADKTLIEWEAFTPTQTTPANTGIGYQFRTSNDGANWTSWSSSQEYSGTPLDLTGLEKRRYLQVKATLTTTDAGATPQIDDYTINFHNNQKPNKPVAQTAVIGN